MAISIEQSVEKVLLLLRAKIRAQGVTQVEVENQLGWKGSYISQLWRKDRRLRFDQILSILGVLGEDPAEFFAELYRLKSPSDDLNREAKLADIFAELAGHEDTFRARAEQVAEEETPEAVAQRLERLRGERVGLLFSWLEGRSRKLLPAAHWLAYGVHAPKDVPVKVPSCAELVIFRALIREEAPGLRSVGRKLIEWSPFAATLTRKRNEKARGKPASQVHDQAPASLA